MSHRFRLATLLACTALFCWTSVHAAQRVVMIEELTSQTCGPCYSSNPSINAFIESYGDQVVSIKWHVWWPSPGDDWFWLINNAVVTDRVNVLYVAPTHAAPSLYIDGGPVTLNGTIEYEQVDSRLLIPSPIAISGTAEVSATSVDVSVDVNVETPMPGVDNRLFAAVVEKHVTSGGTVTGTMTAGSPVITGLSSTEYMLKGSIVCGTGLPACPSPQSATPARILRIDSPTQITLTKNATVSGTRSFSFKSYNWEILHHDVFRMINNNATPALTGDPIDMTTPGMQHFEFSLPTMAEYVKEELAVVVWVQNTGTPSTEIYQAVELEPELVGIGDPERAIAEFGRSFPNPFGRSGTTVPFSLSRDGNVELSVFDVSGRLVSNLVSGHRLAGSHAARWDGTNAAGVQVTNGVYYARLKTAEMTAIRRMVRLD